MRTLSDFIRQRRRGEAQHVAYHNQKRKNKHQVDLESTIFWARQFRKPHGRKGIR